MLVKEMVSLLNDLPQDRELDLKHRVADDETTIQIEKASNVITTQRAEIIFIDVPEAPAP